MRSIFPVVVAAMLLSTPLLAFLPAGGMRASGFPLRVRTEWESPVLNGTANVLFNDTDRDGNQELLLWGNLRDEQGYSAGAVRVYRPLSYSLAWSANFSGYIDELSLVDLSMDGSVELLIRQSGTEGTNFSIFSGKYFSALWQGPDLGGTLYFQGIEDLDADGNLEFVWVNTTVVYDENRNMTYESRIHLYGARSHQKEWESPALPWEVLAFQAVQIDQDAALELFLVTGGRNETDVGTNLSLRAYDGASHALQWSTPPEAGLNALSSLYLGDVDGDSKGEVLVQADATSSSGVRLYAGGNGTLLWNRTLGNTTRAAQAVDIDSDGSPELLATGSVKVDANGSAFNLTHIVFDLRSRAPVWSAGPFLSDQNKTSDIAPLQMAGGDLPDLQLTPLPELVLSNTSGINLLASTVTYDLIDGKTFALKWRSPSFASLGQAYTGGLFATQADSDPALELVAMEAWVGTDLRITGKVRLFSDNSFIEEWASETLPGFVVAAGWDAVNDKRPELVILSEDIDPNTFTMTGQLRILDGDSHAVLWTGPRSSTLDFNISDLYGSSRNEIVYAAINSSAGSVSSTISVYNDTTLAEAWTAGLENGTVGIEFVGDADNDSLGELVTSLQWEDANFDSFTNVTVREFTERAPPRPDLALASSDLAVSNSTPVAGMPLTITARLRNPGAADATGCCVTFLVDGAPAGSRTVDVAKGSLTELNFSWIAAAGGHRLLVAADPEGLIDEMDEANNNASLDITVRERPRPVAVISSPGEGEVFEAGADITFDGTASLFPPGGARSFYWVSESSGYIGNASLSSAILPAGEHRVWLFADDGYHNASASVNFTVEAPKPPPGTTWAVISSPRNNAAFTAGEQLLFDGTKSVPARPEYVLVFNWSSNRTGQLGQTARFFRALPAGIHNITLTVDDGHGGRSSAWAAILVNESMDVVAFISSPLEGQGFDASQDILFDGTRSTGPPGTVLSYVWTSSLAGALSSEKSFSRKLLAGNHTISLRVGDGQGHAATASVNISVTGVIDYPPSVRFDFPAEGAVVSGTVNISGTASDEKEVVQVQVKIDDGRWARASGTSNWTFAWDTTLALNGTHRITVRADDGNQTSPEASINVTVDNGPALPPPPPMKEDTTLLLAVAALVVLAMAAAGVVVYLRARRRMQPPPHDENDSRGPVPPRI